MKTDTLSGLAILLLGLAILLLMAPALGAQARMSLPTGSQQITIQAAPALTKIHLLDGIRDIGVTLTDASGVARLTIGALSAGPHEIRAVKWGTGEIVATPLRVIVPKRPVNPIAMVASFPTGIHADFIASGDLHGEGRQDLILGDASGIHMIHFQDGVFGRPHHLDRALYSTGKFTPSGLTVLDANGDGLNDLAVISTDGRVAVLINRGSGVFSRARFYAVGVHPCSIVSADFNSDGIPDLAIGNQDSNDISILLGDGDGTFQAPTSVSTGYAPRSLVVADFDGDGLPDLATANFAGNNVSVLLGNGHGGFRASADFAAGYGPVDLAAIDMNADGAADLLVFNQIDRTVSVLLNNGDGVFEAGPSIPGVSSVLAADLDADGVADLLVQEGNDLRVRPGSGNGSFSEGYTFHSPGSPLLLATAGVNQEGLPEIAAVDWNGEITVFSAMPVPVRASLEATMRPEISGKRFNPLALSASTTALQASSTSVTFGQSVTLTATVTPSSATGRVTFYDGTNLLAIRTLSSGQAAITTSLLPSGLRSLRVLYSGDGNVAPSTSSVVLEMVTAVANGGFQAIVGYSTPAGPYAVAIADLNGDGKADLAVANSGAYPNYAGSVSVYLGNGDGTFRPAVTYATGTGSSFVSVADINGDGAPELILANWGGSVSVLGNKGDGSFFPPANYSVGHHPYALALGDFNADGNVDIAVANSDDSTISLLLGSGNGGFAVVAAIAGGNIPEAIVTGDFNGDGNADLAVANSAGVSILLGKGNATFQPPVTYAAGTTPYSVAVGDFNGDGKSDLAVANLDSGNVSVLIGNGDGTFRSAVNYLSGINPEYVAVGDFNGDGLADLAVANYGPSSLASGNLTVLYGQGNGTFQSGLSYVAGLTPFFLAAGNLNGDGMTDLAVVDLTGSSIGVMLGRVATPPARLKFITIPASLLPGTPTTVVVQIQDVNGNWVSNSNAPVTLVSTPAGISSTVNAVNGIARFNGVVFGSSGSYLLTASSAGLTSDTYNLPVTGTSFGVSGRVTVSGTGLGGVVISVNGSQTVSTTTDASGNYSIPLAINGAYTLAPALSGYSFSPPVSIPSLGTSQTVNFTGVAAAGLQFYPIPPCRIADTRTVAGFSGLFGPPSLAAGTTRTFPIPASACGIPATAGAYSLNFTAIPRGVLGLLTAWPAGQAMPNTSTLSSYTGAVVANAAIVPAGAGGAINIYVNGETDVLFDINGYFAPPSGNSLQFYPVTPCRIADTRAAAGFSGAFGPPMMLAGLSRTFPIPSSSCGIPSTAAAYSLNFTVIPPSSLGVLTTWPTGSAMPNVSTLNSYTGNVLANAAIVPAGANGAINVYVNDPTEMLFDINGYFAPPQPSGLNFYPVTPCRIADTRTVAGFTGPFGPTSLVAGVERAFPIPSSTCEIPASAGAYSLNFTVVPPGPLGLLTTWPTGSARPNASTLNSYNGTVVANAAIVPAGANGAISVYVNNTTNTLFDINGYFAK